MTIRAQIPVDLERLDESADDLGAWSDEASSEQDGDRRDTQDGRARTRHPRAARTTTRDEAVARTRLYPRTGLIDVSPIDPPIT